eukprot:767382-Hanusia_phi.AAC.7
MSESRWLGQHVGIGVCAKHAPETCCNDYLSTEDSESCQLRLPSLVQLELHIKNRQEQTHQARRKNVCLTPCSLHPDTLVQRDCISQRASGKMLTEEIREERILFSRRASRFLGGMRLRSNGVVLNMYCTAFYSLK